jgi:Ca-activated chloride channel family protein
MWIGLIGAMWLANVSSVSAEQLKLDVALAKPSMLAQDPPSRENHLRIALTGFKLPSTKERMPANISIVIDKSGSMNGPKIQHARDAAIQAVNRLVDNDIVSVITYDNSVNVVVPATKASDRIEIVSKIQSIQASGGTALFAGVSKGAAEVRKFLDPKRVNRVILLSDGQANVGPQTPSELSELGRSLIKEGISVTTMGLGLDYNEDLMSGLAQASSGNHVFVESPEYLAKFFQDELNDVVSVVAQKIEIRATLAEGIRPVKVLGYPAEIVGQLVAIDLGQLYSEQERYFVLEVEIPKSDAGTQMPVASVAVQYTNMLTETLDKLNSTVAVKFTNDAELAEKEVNKAVAASCVLQIANERNRVATELRDRGSIDEAKKMLELNADYLGKQFALLGASELNMSCNDNKIQAKNLDASKWIENRKAMRSKQYESNSQQRYNSGMPPASSGGSLSGPGAGGGSSGYGGGNNPGTSKP